MSVKPYQPSNGTEAMMFMAEFCHRCKRDAAYQAWLADERGPQPEGCDIAERALLDTKDPAYPKEWVWDPEQLKRDGALLIGEGGARCTAFERKE